jgi:methionyl aminopeptidase
MVYYKSNQEIEIMKIAGKIVADCLNMLEEHIQPGVSTGKLDKLAEDYIRSHKALPGFKGYNGFPATLCTSINDEVVHGIPGDRILQDGDILSIDCGTIYQGYYGDHARTFPVGDVSLEKQKLMDATQKSLEAGIMAAQSGNTLGDIGAAVQQIAESDGYSVVRSLVGHGVGRNLHEDPQVPNYGTAGKGMRLRPGLVLAIEPMVNAGTYEVYTKPDGWTIATRDKKNSAHFEHTIVITKEGPLVLTAGY